MPNLCQNDLKIIPKSSQIHPKNIPTSSQKHPKIIPKASQNRFKLYPKSYINHYVFQQQLIKIYGDSDSGLCKVCNYTYNTILWRKPVLNEEIIVNVKS